MPRTLCAFQPPKTQKAVLHAVNTPRANPGIGSPAQNFRNTPLHGGHFTDKEKKQYQLGKLAGSEERAFKTTRIARVVVKDRDTGEVAARFLYTPVTATLVKGGEKLGDLLHRQHFRPLTDPWWTRTRSHLEDLTEQLALANRGARAATVEQIYR